MGRFLLAITTLPRTTLPRTPLHPFYSARYRDNSTIGTLLRFEQQHTTERGSEKKCFEGSRTELWT